MRVETTCTNLNLPCPHPYPINVRARRALHIYYLLFIIYYLNCPSGAISSPMVHRSQRPGKSQQKNSLTFSVRLYLGALCSGLSRALKTPHRGVFAPRYAERGARAVLVPDGAPILNIPGNGNKKTPRNFLRGVCFGAPSGTRTQDPLIKSQLLSQVASSRGVENSVTQTDSGLYIYFYNLCLTVLENNIISDHLQLISPLSIGSVADYVYRAICFSNFLIKCCSCF